MNEPWGDRLLAICREPNTSELSGAEREDLKEEQLRNIARLLVQLIQELACPDQSGRSISSSNTAQIWQENECPMQPKHSVGINVSGEYVKAMFGERDRQERTEEEAVCAFAQDFLLGSEGKSK